MNKSELFISCTLLFAAACHSPVKKSEVVDSEKPNIVFILADDLGYGDVGCYGQRILPTPNVDRLASEGLQFANFYSGSAVCAPSRCSLLTGKHTGHSSLRGNKWTDSIGVVPLLPEDITISEALKGSGYTTGICGRWHLGGEKSDQKPLDNGFDYHFGKLSSLHRNTHGVLIDDLFDEKGIHKTQEEYAQLGVEPMYEYGKYYNLEEQFLKNRPVVMDEMVTAKAIDFIQNNKNNPFFLYVAFSLVHAPLELMKETAAEYPEWPEKKQKFASMLKYLDLLVGKIVNAVDEAGMSKNTLIIFTSDNGPHDEDGQDPNFFDSNGPLRGIKRDLYEGGIRMPMIARWPGTIAPGQTTNHISAFWDIQATVCDLAGVEPPEDTDGISFAPLLKNEVQAQHEYLYWEFDENGRKQAVRKENWKAVYFIDDDHFELYDLNNDIGEQTNVRDSYPDVSEAMKQIMKEAHRPSKRFPILKEELVDIIK